MKNVVVFSGSGISAESGIQTFRDAVDGLWNNYVIAEVATPEGWRNDKKKLLDFYNERRSQLLEVYPNKGHLDLVKLEEKFNVTIITQNVDDLHERAGTKNIIHLHGELTKVRSTVNPTLIYDWKCKPLNLGDKCEKGSQLRPHVVWFNEQLNDKDVSEAINKIKEADYIVIIGTSLSVYPANEFPFYNSEYSTKYYLVDPSDFDVSMIPQRIKNFKHIKEKSSTGTEKVVDEILSEA
jgi:NAD-dependent deacetylase